MKVRVFLLCCMATSLIGTSIIAEDPPTTTVPAIELPPLPYAQDALEPYVSEQTLEFHYGKHHQGYVDNLNRLIDGTSLAGQPLASIVRETAGAEDNKKAIFNNAAQVWNHTFFWNSMKPEGGGQPEGLLLERIEDAFGDFHTFKDTFIDAATGQFGSGWVWLVQDDTALKIVTTSNADTPAAHGQTALLTCDVWEHAYYLDYQNRRKQFVETFLEHLANWDFASTQMK